MTIRKKTVQNCAYLDKNSSCKKTNEKNNGTRNIKEIENGSYI